MKQSYLTRHIFTLVYLVLLGLISGCLEPENTNTESLQKRPNYGAIDNDFTRDYLSSIPVPNWYDAANRVELNDFKDLQGLWSSRKHCCVDKQALIKNHQELFRSCDEAILRNTHDEQLVFGCLYLQENDIDPDSAHELKRLGYSHYPNFKTDFNQYRCANCMVGDSYARLTKRYAQVVAKNTGSIEEGLGILDDLINRRIQDISPWIQTELFTEYARMVIRKGDVSRVRFERVNDAFNRLSQRAIAGDETVKSRLNRLENQIQRLQSLVDRNNSFSQ